MKYISILKVDKSEVKQFFAEGSWSNENMTSVLIRRENGKLIQVFGSGRIGDYHDMEDKKYKLVNDRTCRSIGYGTVVDFAEATNMIKGAAYYVFK